MPDDKTQGSPSPEKGGKLFESIRGAHSRDPEVAAEAAEQPTKTEPTEGSEPVKPAAEPGGSGDPNVLKLKQEVAKLQRQLGQMGPWAQLGIAVGQEDRAALERFQRGEKVLQRAANDAATTNDGYAPSSAGLTLEQINALMDQRDAAKEQIRRLNELGRENLEHFDAVSKNQLYAEFLDNNLRSVWAGRMELDPDTLGWADDGLARNYTAVKRSYRQVLADNPKVVEAAKRAGQAEARERAEAALAASGPSGSKTSSHEEPPPKSEAEDMIDRMVNARGIGKPFRTIGRARR